MKKHKTATTGTFHRATSPTRITNSTFVEYNHQSTTTSNINIPALLQSKRHHKGQQLSQCNSPPAWPGWRIIPDTHALMKCKSNWIADWHQQKNRLHQVFVPVGQIEKTIDYLRARKLSILLIIY